MPFGLMNAPAVFQRFINEVLKEALDRYAYVYLDDILIFSRTQEEHMGHVLYVKLEKSEFHVSKVSFLGFIVSKGTLAMDPAKIRAVWDWPRPTSLKAVQRFLGFANFFQRFVRNFSMVAAPLTTLTRKTPGHFHWTNEAQQAFEELTRHLTTVPVLQLPDPRAPFIVEVDASDVGVGAVLSQRSGSPNKLHPCAYYSHRLTPAAWNYDVGDRELLAIKLALEEWRHWLEGAEHPFVVWTDHKNLAYIKQAKRLNQRQACWSLFFGRLDFVLTYRPGSENLKLLQNPARNQSLSCQPPVLLSRFAGPWRPPLRKLNDGSQTQVGGLQGHCLFLPPLGSGSWSGDMCPHLPVTLG
ncbi:hypothetical protein NFI96_001048 [Prochilodus magdalenae]|nr:hypothetical protein NFI96_001048 [Prochilodus magdalenae]